MSATGSHLPESRRAGGECLSDLALDQLHMGERPAPQAERDLAHLRDCVACSAAFDRIRASTAAYLAETNLAAVADRALLAHQAARPWWRPRLSNPWPLLAPLAAAAAAGVMLFALGVPDSGIPGGEPGSADTARDKTHLKGSSAPGFSLSTYVRQRGSAPNGPTGQSGQSGTVGTGTLYMGDALSPGDQIQFRVTSDRAGYVAIVSVDEAAQVSVYYPAGELAEALPAGRDRALATAVELDDTPGTEVVIGLRCPQAFAVAEIVDAVRNAVEDAVAKGHAPTAAGALGLPCTETRVSLTKVARGPALVPR